MIKNAIRKLLLADSSVTKKLATYSFTSDGTKAPAIFTIPVIPEDATYPAVILSSIGGADCGTRGQRGVGYGDAQAGFSGDYAKKLSVQNLVCDGITGGYNLSDLTGDDGTYTDCEIMENCSGKIFTGCTDLTGCHAEENFTTCSLMESCTMQSDEYSSSYGLFDCSNVSNMTIVHTISGCSDLYNCNVTAHSTTPYSYIVNCTGMESCSISGNHKGFAGCSDLTDCTADSIITTSSDYTGIGFYDCDDLTGCTSSNNADVGFYQCNTLTTCSATNNTNCGYLGCTGISSDCVDSGNGGSNCDEVPEE